MRNKYPGNCCICTKHLAIGAGYVEPGGIRCEDCVGKGAPWKQKCHKCGKKLLAGEGHYNKTKEDEGGGWYSTKWTVYCEECNKEVSDE